MGNLLRIIENIRGKPSSDKTRRLQEFQKERSNEGETGERNKAFRIVRTNQETTSCERFLKEAKPDSCPSECDTYGFLNLQDSRKGVSLCCLGSEMRTYLSLEYVLYTENDIRSRGRPRLEVTVVSHKKIKISARLWLAIIYSTDQFLKKKGVVEWSASMTSCGVHATNKGSAHEERTLYGISPSFG